MSPDPVVITTPEQVSFRLQPAGLSSRVRAYFLDGLITWGLKILVIIALGFFDAFTSFSGFGFALVSLAVFGIDFGYHSLFEYKKQGQTPGKKAVGVRVVSITGGRLSLSQTLLRCLLRPIDSLPILMTTGGLVAWLDPHHRRLGDHLAGTLVITAQKPAPPVTVPGGLQQDNSFAENTAIQARIRARITREERDLWLDLMHRRDQLAPLPRAEVFQQAADHCRDKYQLPIDDDHLSDEQTVLNVARIAQADQ